MTRTLGRTLLLSAVAVVFLHGRSGAAEENPLGRTLEFQKKLAESGDWQVPVMTTLDKVLDDLLTRNGIPYSINEAAFIAAMQDKDVVKKTQIDKIEKVGRVTRATFLQSLLQQVPASYSKGLATYLLHRDHLEITTLAARAQVTNGARTPPEDGDFVLPPAAPLTYAAFDDVPLQDALKELAHATESSIIVDARSSAEAKGKVTAELPGVPLDVAVQLLADMTSLKLVRVGIVYYVTSPKNADMLQKEEDKRRRGQTDDPVPSPVMPGLGLGGWTPTPAPTPPAPTPPPAPAQSPAPRLVEPPPVWFRAPLNRS